MFAAAGCFIAPSARRMYRNRYVHSSAFPKSSLGVSKAGYDTRWPSTDDRTTRNAIMFDTLKKFAMITGSAAMLSTGALAAVPKAASASTTSTLLTAAGVIGALVLYNNYQHKRQAANQ